MKARATANRPGTVLITGASKGIGLALAREFAIHGHRLILTAPDRSELADAAAESSATHGVEAGIKAADLERTEAPVEIFDAVLNDGHDVEILVNNAGLGFRGNFREIPIEQQLSIVHVNIQALLHLTHLFLTGMKRR